jgi:hypothetical protein
MAFHVARTSPTPQDPATTSTARSAGAEAERGPCRGSVRQAAGIERLGGHDRTARYGGAAGAVGSHLGRPVVDGQVQVDPVVDPQRVDAEVGDEVDSGMVRRRDPQPAEAKGGQG